MATEQDHGMPERRKRKGRKQLARTSYLRTVNGREDSRVSREEDKSYLTLDINAAEGLLLGGLENGARLTGQEDNVLGAFFE